MLGHFIVGLANVVCIGSLAPRSCVAMASCRTRHLCALCISPFPSIQSALDSHASSPYRTPLPLSLFSKKHGRPHASLVEHTSYLLSFISHPLACVESAPWPCLSPQHEPFVYPIHTTSTSGVLRPTSIRLYKIPLVLALFLLHPIPSHSE